MLRDQIKKDLAGVLKRSTDYGLPTVKADEIEVTWPSDPQFGDYTTNIALKISHPPGGRNLHPRGEIRKNEQSPLEFASVLAGSLHNLPYIKKLEVKEPGFINFFIKDQVLQKEIKDLLKKKKFDGPLSGQKIIVEFTDPNPFKEFHVGHLYSNSVGESISRLLEVTGASVKRANYQGDVGLHVAKSIWGMRKKVKSPDFAASFALRRQSYGASATEVATKAEKASTGKQKSKVKSISDLESWNLQERTRFLGLAYAAGASAYETDTKSKEEIVALNKEIYQKRDAIEEYKLGKKWSLEHFEEIYKRLGTRFDFYYFESQAGTEGLQIVKKHIRDGVFEKSQGAIIFPGEKYGLHNRVFVTSQGLPTYEAKELGLAFKKYEDFVYDLSIIVTGNEISEYFKVLLAALKQVRPALAVKTRHVTHGMVRMPRGKISSRLGNVIAAEQLLDEAKTKALELTRQKGLAQESDVGKVAEQIGTGAVKYALLKGNPAQDINFSFEEAISLEGNSGPYLQYTYSRCRSVLEKGQKLQRGQRDQRGQRVQRLGFKDIGKEEELLLRTLVHFEEVLVDVAEAFAPNLVANFLYDMAQKYNAFYNNLRIIDAKEPNRSRRLFLTEATAGIIKKGLYLLGISAPQKM